MNYKGWKDTEWWQGTDYVVAKTVRQQLALHARHSTCYGWSDHDGDCIFDKPGTCEPCRREYRQARWDLYRAAKAVCWDTDNGSWERFVDLLKENGLWFWE